MNQLGDESPERGRTPGSDRWSDYIITSGQTTISWATWCGTNESRVLDELRVTEMPAKQSMNNIPVAI